MKLYIRSIRKKKRMSLRKLAKASGLSPGYLSELENEFNNKKNPTLKTICRLSKALKVEITELFDYVEGED